MASSLQRLSVRVRYRSGITVHGSYVLGTYPSRRCILGIVISYPLGWLRHSWWSYTSVGSQARCSFTNRQELFSRVASTSVAKGDHSVIACLWVSQAHSSVFRYRAARISGPLYATGLRSVHPHAAHKVAVSGIRVSTRFFG